MISKPIFGLNEEEIFFSYWLDAFCEQQIVLRFES